MTSDILVCSVDGFDEEVTCQECSEDEDSFDEEVDNEVWCQDLVKADILGAETSTLTSHEAAVMNEYESIESLLVPWEQESEVKRWTWKVSKNKCIKGQLIIGPDGVLMHASQRLIVEGTQSAESSILDKDDGPPIDNNIEHGWWQHYYCWELCLAASYSAQLEFPSNEKML